MNFFPFSDVLFWVLIVLLAVFVLSACLNRIRLGIVLNGPSKSLPPEDLYQACQSVLTPAEQKFYLVLNSALGEEYIIFSKVRCADLISPRSGLANIEKKVAFNRVVGKHLDFVLCDRASFRVCLIIELDDSSHLEEKRKERDRFLDSAIKGAGLALYRYRVQRDYSEPELKNRLLGAIKKNT